MRVSSSFIALVALPSLSLAASLSDFKPRVDNLPSNCQTVYTAAISGCSGSDFSGTCSANCIKGLQSMTMFVQAACGGISFQSSNLISVFLSGMGPASLCPNLKSAPSNAAPSTTAQTQSQTTASTMANTASSSSASTTSTGTNTSSTASAKSTASSSTTTGTSSDQTSATSSSTSTQASSKTSSIVHAQASCTSSSRGGGSPFDVQGTTCSSASTLSIWSGATMLLAAVAIVSGL